MVSRDEFRKLQNTNITVGKLENDFISLSREQEEAQSDARLVQEKTAEIERLNKENARLTEELKPYKSAAVQAQTGKSEEQHQLLSTEVQPVQGSQDIEIAGRGAHRNAKPGGSVLATISTNLSLSSGRVEKSDSNFSTLERYNSLVTKYNQVFQNWTDIKASRTLLEKSLRAEKDKTKRYNLFCEGLEKKLDQKRDKIRQLEDKTRSLEEEILTLKQSNVVEVAQVARKEDNLGSFEDDTRLFEPAPVSAAHGCQAVTSLEPSAVNNIAPFSPQIEFPTSNNPKLSTCNEKQLDPEKQTGAELKPGGRDKANNYSSRPDQNCESEFNELPVLSDVKRAGNHAAEDAPYEITEPYHSSSTDDRSLNSPSNLNGHGTTIKTESQESIQSPQDIPVIVQERSVRKRKSHQSPGVASRIKVETISSSPIGLAALHELEEQESVDLDDIGYKQMTPRKQRALIHDLAGSGPHGPRSGSRPSRNIQQEAVSARPPSSILKYAHISQRPTMIDPEFQAGSTLQGSTLQSSNSANEFMPRKSSHRAKKRRRVTHDLAIQELVEDGEKQGAIEGFSSLSEWSDSDGRLMKLLENPMPSNPTVIRIAAYAPPNGLQYNTKLPTVLDATSSARGPPMAARSLSLASYSSPPLSPSDRITSRRLETAPKYHSNAERPNSRENSNCLNGDRDPIIPANLSMTSAELHTPAHGGLLAGAVTLQLPKSLCNHGPNSGQSASTTKRSSHLRGSGCSVKDEPKNESLRYRPLGMLGVHDFKINPEYNNGYNYAFTDVVRKQAARRCLPGCTKPECCGNIFRALAAAARDPNKLVTASQEEAETSLLKEFLGDNANKIRNMTRAERNEALLQAKTRELANKHGKHRHAYERRRSPPGFWRIDFPSTQEEREDRQKIEQFERDVVAQRYSEAMRPGGAYLFRDE